MNPLERRLLLRERARRAGAQSSSGATKAQILAALFDKQRGLLLDPSREKAALCPRRAGKTTFVPAAAFYTLAGQPPGRIVRYWGITQDRAYQLMWAPIGRAAKRFGINAKPNEDLMTYFLPGGCEIRLVGADKAKEAEKKRGDATLLDIVDECSLYGSFLKMLVEDVIGPSQMDYGGTTILMGTPGVLFSGYWFAVTGPDEAKNEDDVKVAKSWTHHAWDVYDNPFMPQARDEIERLRVTRGWSLAHPTYQREYRGKWVKDTEGLFYSYDPERNSYDGVLPKLPPGQSWTYVMGWDIGGNDDMALVVWAYCDVLPDVYEVESWKKPHVLISEVAAEVRRIEKRLGRIHRKVADTGGGGNVTVNEMNKREHIYFEPAKKTDKPGIVRFMNDDFTSGHIKTKKGSPLSEEYAVLMKDPDDPEKEDPRCPNHCADAGLYSYRDARHYDAEEVEEKPPLGTKEHFDTVAKQLERDALDKLQREASVEWWER